MPEGHTVHRLARQHLTTFGGHVLAVDSPQGRFAAGAARLDGRVLAGAQAHGKHLFLGFADDPDDRPDAWLHVHLGLYGKWAFGLGTPPEPRGAVRVRFVTKDAAEKYYGAVFKPDSDEIDRRATQTHRADMKQQGLPHDEPITEIIIPFPVSAQPQEAAQRHSVHWSSMQPMPESDAAEPLAVAAPCAWSHSAAVRAAAGPGAAAAG